ncbi:hypothetical protein V1511DRAFT_497033 [Dipodascopsis uninucleata]
MQQGCVENAEMVHLANIRATAEEAYGIKLQETGVTASPKSTGFARDEGASLKKAYDGILEKNVENGLAHLKIAENIRQMVVYPFSRWALDHERRVVHSHEDTLKKVRLVEKLRKDAQKARLNYFNRARLIDNLESEQSFAFQDPNNPAVNTNENVDPMSPSRSSTLQSDHVSLESKETNDGAEEIYEVGSQSFTHVQISELLTKMLDTIPTTDVRIAILGTYKDTSSGQQIVDWIMRNMDVSTLAGAENVGQDLVDYGFLRLVGAMGNTFANSSVFKYQWRKKAFIFAGKVVPDNKDNIINEYLGGIVSAATGNSNISISKDETPRQRLLREATQADETYKDVIRRLDSARCVLEEALMAHYKNLEKYELERLHQIKSAMLVFSAAISNVIPSMQAAVDGMMLFQETVSPEKDLRYMLERYRTGSFLPQTEVHESYYMSSSEQVFGVSLETRAREDGRKIPFVVTCILSYMDEQYPELDDDKTRQEVWFKDVSLATVHQLRNEINNGKTFSKTILAKYNVAVVTNVLKLYFLELRESLIDPKLYETIKAYYNSRSADGDERESVEEAIIEPISNLIGQMMVYNIATLDALMSHFTRLMDLTSAKEEYVTRLAYELARLVLRPRVENSLTFEDRHGYRLVLDLFKYKQQIFSKLKRKSSMTKDSKARQISGDERNRRLLEEERNRALAYRARSPGASGGTQSGSHNSTSLASRISLVLTPQRKRGQYSISSIDQITSEGRSSGGEARQHSHSRSKTLSSVATLNEDQFKTEDDDNNALRGRRGGSNSDDATVVSSYSPKDTDSDSETSTKRTSLQYGEVGRMLVGGSDGDNSELEKAKDVDVDEHLSSIENQVVGVRLIDKPMDDDEE